MTSRGEAFPLGPLTFVQALEAAFRLWRRHFAAFFLLSVLAAAPGQLLIAWYQAANVIDIASDGTLIVEDPNRFALDLALIAIVALLINLVMWAALVDLGVNAYMGIDMAPGDAIRDALGRIFPFVGLAVVYAVMVGVGLFLVVAPGLYLGVRFVQAFPAFYAERLDSPMRALRRGGELAAGRWWWLFGLLLVAWLAAFSLQMVVGQVLSILNLGNDSIVSAVSGGDGLAARFYVDALVASVSSGLFFPLLPLVTIVAYFDGRARLGGGGGQFDPPGGNGYTGPEADETGGW